MKKTYTTLIISLLGLSLSAQSFYDTETIQEIKIYFQQTNWDEELDRLFVEGEEERLLAAVEINGERFDSVGIRYKGFSSVSVDRVKNPFNIKLDYVKNQDYDGFDKIKLSNVIQDPSFVREVLSYDIARNYMPASRANHAKVYVNDQYWGLYVNVESVDKDFLSIHFSTIDDAFFKCNPDHLDLDGENSNLSNSPGNSPEDYHELYDMRSDEGWEDLLELIQVLNDNPEEIETVLNVDQALWMHAFNYALINFDSYIGYAQNYYLYKEQGVFHPILWDLNMSFGSFRFTDASENFDGFSARQAQRIDPLLHHNSVSILPRPLMRNLFANDTYRRMYLAHIRTIMEENFDNGDYKSKAEALQTLVSDAVESDANKFYGFDDFQNNLTQTVSDLIEYPGIFDLMDNRSEYLKDYEGIQGAPEISRIETIPTSPIVGEEMTITAYVLGAINVQLAYRFNQNEPFKKVGMFDDGTHNDGTATDATYGAIIPAIGANIEYYIYGENEEAGRFSPERAAFEFHKIQATSTVATGEIVINEFQASNDATAFDEEGEFDDWIELYNTTNADINLSGLFLSDKEDNLTKFALPDYTLPANGYVIIWADEDGSQGDLHANFKLSASGETILLSSPDSMILDMISYDTAMTDLSWARRPNGTGNFEEGSPTFNMNNDFSSVTDFVNYKLEMFPNPANELLNLQFGEQVPEMIQVFDINGLPLRKISKITNPFYLKTDKLSAGLYSLKLRYKEGVQTKKFIVNR